MELDLKIRIFSKIQSLYYFPNREKPQHHWIQRFQRSSLQKAYHHILAARIINGQRCLRRAAFYTIYTGLCIAVWALGFSSWEESEFEAIFRLKTVGESSPGELLAVLVLEWDVSHPKHDTSHAVLFVYGQDKHVSNKGPKKVESAQKWDNKLSDIVCFYMIILWHIP